VLQDGDAAVGRCVVGTVEVSWRPRQHEPLRVDQPGCLRGQHEPLQGIRLRLVNEFPERRCGSLRRRVRRNVKDEVQLIVEDIDQAGVPGRICRADNARHSGPVQCRDLQPTLVAEMNIWVLHGYTRHNMWRTRHLAVPSFDLTARARSMAVADAPYHFICRELPGRSPAATHLSNSSRSTRAICVTNRMFSSRAFCGSALQAADLRRSRRRRVAYVRPAVTSFRGSQSLPC
jgi:hypothetical protein